MAGTVENILNTLTQTAQVVLPLYQQQQLLQLNVKRAEQGLPPIKPEDYAAGVNVGVSSETQKMIYILVGAVLAYLLIKEFGGRRA